MDLSTDYVSILIMLLANYAVPHPLKKANYAARCGKFLQNVLPDVVNVCKMCGNYAAILCKLCGNCAAGVLVFWVSGIDKI